MAEVGPESPKTTRSQSLKSLQPIVLQSEALKVLARPGQQLLLAGSMDGSVSLLDAETGQLLHSSKPHTKYVVSVAWAGDGRRFVSGSWDSTVAVHCTAEATASADKAAETAKAKSGVAGTSAGGSSGSGGSGVAGFETLKVFQYTAQVQSVAFLADGDTAVVAVRDSNYLRLLGVGALEARALACSQALYTRILAATLSSKPCWHACSRRLKP